MKVAPIIALASLLFLGAVQSPQPSSSSHEEAVGELFQLMNLERTMVGAATAMIDAQIQGNTAIAPYRDVMLEWAAKYLTWRNVAPGLTMIYKEAFTESEIREMVSFYRTPTGQKALTKLPELMQKGAAIGAEVAKAHQADLERMLTERQKQLESEKAP